MRILLLLLVVLPLAWAQFPAVCNTDESLNTKTCCPNDCGTRGTCVSITAGITASWMLAKDAIVEAVCNRSRMTPVDVRCQWPLRVYNRVCSCIAGWGGYNCSHCDFGYITAADGSCVKRNGDQLLVRRNFMELTMQKQLEYITVLKAAKNETDGEKEWAVVVSEPNDMNGRFGLQNVSTYDMFVAHHFLSTREKDNDNCKTILQMRADFAHEGSAFATWHRYYLLIFERELHRVAERMGISNFTLAYWDWTQGNRLFTPELFGEPQYCEMPMNVSGTLFDMWPVVWDQHYTDPQTECNSVRALYNIDEERTRNRPLKRGFNGTSGSVTGILPNDDITVLALASGDYRVDSDYLLDSGFTKRLEGFVDLCRGDNPCISTDGINKSNNLHNAVHIFLNGHMSKAPSASNDPIFFLHHANIDRIFESWLRKFNGNPPPYMPTIGDHPGHNRDDYLIPFFPLKTNADMYKISSEFGFRYSALPWTIPGSDYSMCDSQATCIKEGTFPDSPEVNTCEQGGTTSSPTSGGGGTSPDAGTSDFHVPLHLILITGTCAVLAMFNLFSL